MKIKKDVDKKHGTAKFIFMPDSVEEEAILNSLALSAAEKEIERLESMIFDLGALNHGK